MNHHVLDGGRQTDLWPEAIESLTWIEECDNLRKVVPEPQGKMQPPWAEASFSYRFTGLPPLASYVELES